MKFFSYIFICNLHFLSGFGSWSDQLSDFEILPLFNIRFSRSTLSSQKLNFQTKYRNFKLILKPNENLFSSNFKSISVDRYGNETPIFIDITQYYTGFVSGDSKSSVRAFLSHDMINMNILADGDIYQIESLSRYEKNNSSLIVYRYRDLKLNHSRPSLCPSKKIKDSFDNQSINRQKRSSEDELGILSPSSSVNRDSTKKLCTIKLVADYRFHMEHGKGDKTRTHNYMIELIDNINQLFKNTEFVDANNNKYTGYGFLIHEIVVHEDWTDHRSTHYNERRSLDPNAWRVEDLLNSFGKIDHSEVCLAHLFTYQSFLEGTLGLAWIATSRSLSNGGICSERIPREDRQLKSVNTAWSTYKDAGGNHLVSMSAYLVTAHELGHNWGADHDPDTTDCSPNAMGGGKYVMYTYSVSGYDKNNRIFSPCSKRSIGATIATRGEYCFQSKDHLANSYCGNSRVEEEEECDLGRDNTNDSCCTPDCHFRPGAVCSPYNHECCTKYCQLKPSGEICASADPFNPCLDNAVCNGHNKDCPPPRRLTGPNCTEHGQCVHGKCKPYCENLNKEACICDKIENACLICCREKSVDNKIHECVPVSVPNPSVPQSRLMLNNGRPCAQGVCLNGICTRKVHKFVERIWTIIERFDKNLFAEFLLDNLVSTVIILTLVLWIPASILVSCNDAKLRKKLIQERSFRRPQSVFTNNI